MYDIFTTVSRGDRVTVLVCRNQHPKKENFKMGRGGKEGVSINVMECHSRGTTLLIIKITILLLV